MCCAGEVVWALQWANVRAPELRGQQNRDADHVVLHERVPAAPYDIKCASAGQARELLHRVQHHLMSLLQVRMLDADLAGSSIEDAEIPPAEVRSPLPPPLMRRHCEMSGSHPRRLVPVPLLLGFVLMYSNPAGASLRVIQLCS